MENRLPFLRQLILSTLFSTLFFLPSLTAQLDFTFNYSGPDTLFVDESCTAILDWGAPASISATCNNAGCVITTFEVFSITNNYEENDSVPAGIKVLITYFVQDNQGNDAFFGFDIDIVDTIPPMFDSTSMPMSLDVMCLDQVPDPPAIEDIIATDNCPPMNAPPVDVVVVYEGQSNVVPPCEAGTFTRTWTATDEYGNSTEYVQTVNVTEDVDPPVITGFPSDLTEACEDADYVAWITAQRMVFMATDNGCGIDSLYDDAPATFMSSCDSVTVTFTAEDGCGLTTTTEATYTVTDASGPIITPPAVVDITLECTDVPADPLVIIDTWSDSLIAVDNCDTVTWLNDFVDLSGGCGGSTGTASVTYTASDRCGHTSEVTINFTVEDNTPPSIDTPPADEEVPCDGLGNQMALSNWLNASGGAMVSDVCTDSPDITMGLKLAGNNVSVAQIQDSLNQQLINTCGASLGITFTFTDACGNVDSAAANFVVTDMEAPVWDEEPMDLEIECDGTTDPQGAIANWLANNGGGTATDACGSVSYEHDFTGLSDACGETGQATVTFIAKDNCGNQIDKPVLLSIVDKTPPVWDTEPEDLNIECDASIDPTPAINAWLAANGNGMASDACGAMILYTHDYTALTPACGETASATVTFTAEDECGLQTTATANINISDTTPPDWTTEPVDLDLFCDGITDPTAAINTWLSNNGNGTATDACSLPISYTHDYTGLTNGCTPTTGTATVIFTAEDACGNPAEVTATITVIDNVSPTWDTDPDDLLINCDGMTDITVAINTWLVNDGNGAASDACGNVNITNDYAGANPGCTPMDAVVVTFTATDDCMNEDTRIATITIIDSGAPTIDKEAESIVVDCDNPVISFTDWLATHGNAEASDNCYVIDNANGSGDWNANQMPPVPACGNTYSQVVEFVVSDACGNTASTTATYTVEDNTNPFFTTNPMDLEEPCGGDDQMALNDWIDAYGGAVAADGCGNTSWLEFDFVTSGGQSNTNVSFTTYSQYPVVLPGVCDWSVDVTFRVVDDCGQANSATAKFSVFDNVKPVFIGIPADETVNCGNVPGPAIVDAIDDCDLVVDIDYSADTLPGVCPVLEIITRTWTATDDCGNEEVRSQVIMVQDTVAPILMGVPADATADCDNIPNAPTLGATDACDSDPAISLAQTDNKTNNGTCSDFNYEIVRTWTATDDCGNTSTGVQIITVSDTEAPTFTGPANIALSCEQGTSPATTGEPTNLLDNCDPNPIAEFTDVETNNGCANELTIIRTWVVKDACGNTSMTFDQTITVTDEIAPVFGMPAQSMDMDCSTSGIAETAFLNWIAANGNAQATDNCTATGNLNWFAAVPGSYDLNNPLTFPGTNPGALDAGVCPATVVGIIRFETVDFVVYDECNNAVVSTATFTVNDNTSPVFDYCPADATITADPGTCQATVTLDVPVITESCGSSSSNITVNANATISSDNPGNTQVVVNPVNLSFSGLPTPAVSGVAPINLQIDLKGIDAEQATEFFNILGEDGTLLGQTNTSASQCGDVTTNLTIPATAFNTWTTDGVLQITLTPNIPNNQTPDFAINDICPAGNPTGGGSTVEAILSYSTSSPNDLVVLYSINGDTPIAWNPISPITTTIDQGDNDIVYYATDCAGNVTLCSYTLTIEDTEAPTIDCPNDTVLLLTAMDDCSLGLQATLPLPTGISDNCPSPAFSQTQPFDFADALLTFTFDPNYQNYIADDKTFDFVATAANAIGNTVTLTVTVEGDVSDADGFFTLYGEDNSILGVTEANQGYVVFTPGNCMANPVEHPTVVATIPVPVADYNAWAADGIVTISAVSHRTFTIAAPGGPSDGINPSCVTFPLTTPDGQTDGASNITMRLDVNTATPYFYTTGATQTANTNMLPPVIAPTLNFALGETEVFYVIADLVGNEDTCSFLVTVEDPIAPIASCQSTTIFVNPSGVVNFTLDPLEINMGSMDNCNIVDYSVSPATFDCSMAGSSVNVTLVVTDASGNKDSCMAIVAVETEAPIPSYSIGLCGNDTLYLSANPPPAQGNVVYTYLWSGPNGFTSTDENPFIPNATSINSGTYSVQITGLTGCTALGTVEVSVPDVPNVPVIMANDNMLCTTDNLTLTTQQYSGNNVSYHWYAGIFPGGTFMATTVIPTHTLFAPLAPVTNTYFVIVEIDGCFSEASFFTTVEVTDTPVAATNDALLQLCEGETFSIGTTVAGPGITYSWTGPNGFVSDQANPPAFTNITSLQEGIYVLIVSANGCPSIPATTIVNIGAEPAQPVLSSPGLVCEGDAVTLTANITGADQYGWIAPDFTTTTTNTNTLTIPNAALTDAGDWTVFITIDGCSSETSLPVMLFVEAPPSITATNDGPVCSGSDVQLSVTNIAGASYLWSGPNSFVSVMPDPVLAAVAGTYSVTVTSTSGCTSVATTDVTVNILPEIIAVQNSAGPCVSGTEDITLSVEVNPSDPGDYIYQWTGPNNYSSVSDSAVVPNASAADNGSYIVVVTSVDGCTSMPMETLVNVTNTPATPMAITGDMVYCEGETITLNSDTYTGATVVYNWLTPNGPQMTNLPSLIIDNAIVSDSGTYQMFVTVDGCPSELSTVFVLDVNPLPAMPVVTADTSICTGTTIQLSTDLIAGANYQWTGPNGFSETVSNPVIFNASQANAGAYSVIITIDGCSSPASIPVNINVLDGASVATVSNNGPICIDDPGAALLLMVDTLSATPGASYTWYNAANNEIVAGPTTELVSSITDFSAYGEGQFSFYVVAALSTCTSLSSLATTVEMNAIPNTMAFAGEPISVCNATSVSLDALAPTVGTGIWTQVGGAIATIADPGAANTVVSGLQSNQIYTFQWTLSNGACADYSSDQVLVSVNGDTEQSNAGLNIELCEVTSATLSAVPSVLGATGTWSQSPEQQALGVVIVDPLDPNTAVNGMTPGEVYEFTWTLSNAGCGSFSSASVLVTIEANTVTAFAGADFSECGDGTIQLDADFSTSGQGLWTTNNTDLTILEPNNPNTEVQGFSQSGSYEFTWTLDNGICGISSDEVVVTFEGAPQAVDDEFTVPFAGTLEMNVKPNDIIGAPFTVEVDDLPEFGQLAIVAPGEFVFSAEPTYAGEDNFTYTVCSEACPDVCSTATVKITIGEDAVCNIPTVFTPNNDQVNDYFIVPCLATDLYPNNVVSIFNQWGDEVFRAAPYNNDWQGTYNGQELPVATYYYVIDFGKGEKPKAGFIILER